MRISCATSQSPASCATVSNASARVMSAAISGSASAAVQSSESVCNFTAAVSALVTSSLSKAVLSSASASARPASRTTVSSLRCSARAATESRRRFDSVWACDSGTSLSPASTAAKSPLFAAFQIESDQRLTSLRVSSPERNGVGVATAIVVNGAANTIGRIAVKVPVNKAIATSATAGRRSCSRERDFTKIGGRNDMNTPLTKGGLGLVLLA